MEDIKFPTIYCVYCDQKVAFHEVCSCAKKSLTTEQQEDFEKPDHSGEPTDMVDGNVQEALDDLKEYMSEDNITNLNLTKAGLIDYAQNLVNALEEKQPKDSRSNPQEEKKPNWKPLSELPNHPCKIVIKWKYSGLVDNAIVTDDLKIDFIDDDGDIVTKDQISGYGEFYEIEEGERPSNELNEIKDLAQKKGDFKAKEAQSIWNPAGSNGIYCLGGDE